MENVFVEGSKRRRSSSDVEMKTKRGRKASSPKEEEMLEKRVSKKPAAVYVPEEIKTKKSKKTTKAVVTEAPLQRRKRVVTRRPVPVQAVAFPPLPENLPADFYTKIREPIRIPSSVKASSSSRKSSSRSIENRDRKVMHQVAAITDKLEGLQIIEVPKIKLPKIPRDAKTVAVYTQTMRDFTEIETSAKAILTKEGAINNIYTTLKGKDLTKVDDIKKWLKALESRKKDIESFRGLPDVSTLLEEYEEMRLTLLQMLQTYDTELKIYITLFDKHSVKRQEYFGKVNNDKVTAKKEEYAYYLAYYDGMLEKLHDMITFIREEKEKYFVRLNNFETTKDILGPLSLAAQEIVEAYEISLLTLEKTKQANKNDLDDLMALFGKL